MSRARHSEYRQTAAATSKTGNGCLSFYLLPPLAVVLISTCFLLLAMGSPLEAAPLNSTGDGAPSIAPLFTPEVQYWGSAIRRWAAANQVDPNLAATVMQIESCGNEFARSSAGAMGLFQVMPFHFAVEEDPFDPDTNALRGLGYLHRALASSDDNVGLSLAGYNGGLGLIGLGQWVWPGETIRYVYWGTGIYADAARGATTSVRLTEWLQAGGASLCRSAHASLNLP
jgi:soluble lytic murein transglycosylase-like protein